jgi:hypothetical protein
MSRKSEWHQEKAKVTMLKGGGVLKGTTIVTLKGRGGTKHQEKGARAPSNNNNNIKRRRTTSKKKKKKLNYITNKHINNTP